MPRLIKNRAVVDDAWTRLPADTAVDATLPAGKLIVPLALWQARRDELRARGDVGVWLQSSESPQALAGDVDSLPLVALDFPAFTDGRAFSYARILREQLGFRGELRAVGAFIRDQLSYLQRCGFDAFALETSDPEAALASLDDFSEAYQAATDQPLPLFRRRAGA